MKNSYKILFVIAVYVNCVFVIKAQNNSGQSDDIKRIAISPTVPQELKKYPEASVNILKNKMKTMVALNGLSAEEGLNLFVIYPQVSVLKSDVTATTPAMFSLRLEVVFNVADYYSGNIYATSSQEVVGVGKTEMVAYNAAFQQINQRNGKYKVMLEKAKDEIMGYYNTHCDLVISKAKSLAAQRKYFDALNMLNSVPPVCRECFDKCNLAAEAIAKDMPIIIPQTEMVSQPEEKDKPVTTESIELDNNIFLKFMKAVIIGDKVRIHFELINKNEKDFDQHFNKIYETLIVNEKGEEYRILNLKVGATVNNNYLKATLLPDINTELVCEFPRVKEIRLLRFLINDNFYRYKNVPINQ
jgi:hypothetical protein